MTGRTAAAIAGLVVVLGVALFVAGGPARPSGGELIFSYSSTDPGPGGTLALRRWLATLGFETRSVQGVTFEVPEDVDLLFVLGPLEPVRREDAERLREWVGGGRVLVIASDRAIFDEELYAVFGAELLTRGADPIEGATSPVLSRPPFRDISLGTARALRLREPAAVLVGDRERAIVAARRVGLGLVFLSSAPDMLANDNLPRAQNDRFVLNLVADLPPGAVVAFDEFHHGAHLEADLFALLTRTPPGHGLLFAGGAVLAYAALRGRRFGMPLPLEERPPRSSLDYVRSFAALLRRTHAWSLAAERLSRAYRRRLARSLGLRLTSSADEIVAVLARTDPARAARVRATLDAFARPLREQELLASVARADAVVAEVERR